MDIVVCLLTRLIIDESNNISIDISQCIRKTICLKRTSLSTHRIAIPGSSTWTHDRGILGTARTAVAVFSLYGPLTYRPRVHRYEVSSPAFQNDVHNHGCNRQLRDCQAEMPKFIQNYYTTYHFPLTDSVRSKSKRQMGCVLNIVPHNLVRGIRTIKSQGTEF